MDDRIEVTIEPYTVFRAVYGDHVQQWAICLSGRPLITAESREHAVEQADRFGFAIVDCKGGRDA